MIQFVQTYFRAILGILLLLLLSCSPGSGDSSSMLLLASGVQSSCPNARIVGGSISCPLELTGEVSTFAGTGSSGSGEGTGTSASFYEPYSLTTDGANLYVADQSNNKIRKIVIATGEVSTFAGSGAYGSSDAVGTDASFNMPGGITTDGTYLYVSDTYNYKIRKIEIATRQVTTLAGTGMYGDVDAVGLTASFNVPMGLATDGTYLYIADWGNNKIRRLVLSSSAVYTFAGAGYSGNTNATGAAASFNGPTSVTTDGTNLYVTDSLNYTIRKIEISSRVVSTFAGSGTLGYVDGIGVAAEFRIPYGITSDGTYLYVTDYNNHNIRRISISDKQVITIAGPDSIDQGCYSTSCPSGDTDAKGAFARFHIPMHVTSDGTSLFVADRLNHKIRRIR
ncbi:hypothetical protein EHO59_16985 [Leptospira semungkisensis]|uniref:SMP-30/Gluconolactonase/LRE-like region domain-containing protein n=1 Tax=Leptospira semungkisensis TaxID=2484985 RepID=A0A4R9FM86_9LEPT|nr:hypothetical protein [Leptospira semungkisensis]TGJ99540.1 hypothetical protein EHO59_16985 [Leptospira semungkisensis]